MRKVRRIGYQRLGPALLVGELDQHGLFGLFENIHHAPIAGVDPDLLEVCRGSYHVQLLMCGGARYACILRLFYPCSYPYGQRLHSWIFT